MTSLLAWKRLRKNYLPRSARLELEQRAEQSGLLLTMALADELRARADRVQAEQAQAEQVLFERARVKRAQADRRRLEREQRLEQARLERLERLRSAHFLLAIAVQLLPPSERDRYLEEFRAELLDIPRNTRRSHVLSLLRGVFVLRLRRGLKKVTDATARRAKGRSSARST